MTVEDIESCLTKHFPQIRMHGGEATVCDIDADAGEVTIELHGACEGCGLAPMTEAALKNQLPQHVDWVDVVRVCRKETA